MTYQINLTSGALLTTVPDASMVQNYAGVTLIGRSFPGFGTAFNDDIVRLAENFSNNIPPSNPLTGQLWYDNVNQVIKVYNGTVFSALSVSTASASPPSNPKIGDEWFDTLNQQLRVWNGVVWLLIGPTSVAGSGLNGIITASITQNSATYYFANLYADNRLVGLVSSDNLVNPGVVGFTNIRSGINFSTAPTANIVLAGLYNVSNITLGNADQFVITANNGTGDGSIQALGNIAVAANTTIYPTVTEELDLGTPALRYRNIYTENLFATNVSTNAGGSNGQMQYNSGGVLAGANIFVNTSNITSYLDFDVIGNVNITGTTTVNSLTGNICNIGEIQGGNINLTGSATIPTVAVTNLTFPSFAGQPGQAMLIWDGSNFVPRSQSVTSQVGNRQIGSAPSSVVYRNFNGANSPAINSQGEMRISGWGHINGGSGDSSLTCWIGATTPPGIPVYSTCTTATDASEPVAFTFIVPYGYYYSVVGNGLISINPDGWVEYTWV